MKNLPSPEKERKIVKPFDLRRTITKGNRSHKLWRESMMAAISAIRGEKVLVLGPDRKSVEMFIGAVIKRIQENPLLDENQKSTISENLRNYNKNSPEDPKKLRGNRHNIEFDVC